MVDQSAAVQTRALRPPLDRKRVYTSQFNNMVRADTLPSRVMVLDTTLRDGEQTPGIALSTEDKILIAQALDELGVDVIEAGFPAASVGEQEAVGKIAKLGLKSRVCGLARCVKRDIDVAADCGLDYVHTFIATSDIHLKHKLKMTRP